MSKDLVINELDVIKDMVSLPQAKVEFSHTFLNGQYIREMRVPAGTFMVGHKHKHRTINMFVKGVIAMFNPKTNTFSNIEAPLYFISEPGRKIGYAVTDVVWINVFATDKTDVDAIEDDILDKSDLSDIPPEVLKACKDSWDNAQIIYDNNKEAK